ncbi:MAG: tetratricopeptide repeat protein [Pseudonocardiaceae bacterium]|nr:tetratricopeptide repeat protein [Pseudonocardiaceae bacterium]
MEFEVLGPLRVRAEGRPAPLSATMPRTLLGMLLARANTPVSVDVLVDALWAGRADPRAAKKLQLHVHRLRRALGDPGRIRFEHSGYTVRVHHDELDAHRFEALLAEGTDPAVADDPARTVTLLRKALGLWRGEPFGDVADVPLLRSEADRLAELRLTGLEALYAAELASGHATAIVPELAELAARHPLRERLQGLLMTALYRAGRQVDALEVYRRTRIALVDELGLEPGAELARLQQAILSGDLDPDVPATPTVVAPAQLPAGVADFTGRDGQLTAIRAHLIESPGPVPISAVAGTAGVGKTTLAVHVAHQLSEQFPDGQLYVNLRGAEAQPLDPAGVLARFLRALGVDGTAIPDDIEERAALYRSRLAGRRVLVLLDNASGEAQLRPLLPGARGCAVLVTSRTRLTGLGARQVDLAVLDGDQAVELLARVAGPPRVAAEPAAAEQIVRLCGCLPLAVRVAGARLGARPHWQLARLATDLADEHHRLDELRLGDLEVRASLALSYDGLDEPGRCAFRRLGLLDAPDFAAWVAAALVGDDEHGDRSQADKLVDALVDAQLLDVAGRDAAGQIRYRFHDLLRTYARELVAKEPEAHRLAAQQRAFAGWFALADGAARRVTSSTFGVPFDSISGWQPDGDVTAAGLADPLAWFEAEWAALLSTVEQARSVGADGLTCALAERLATFFVVRGRYDDWRWICGVMLAAAQHADDTRQQGIALRGLGELDLLQYRLDDSIAWFGQARCAFEEAGDRNGQALATSGLGAAQVEAGRFTDAATNLSQALAELRELGDRRSEAWALRRLGTMHQMQGRNEQAAVSFEQALAVLDELADPLGRASVLERLGAVRTQQGRGREAHALIERALALRREHDDRFGQARALRSLGELYRAEARWDEAMNCLGDSLRLWRELGLARELARTLASLGAVHEKAGNVAAARTTRSEARRLLTEAGLPVPDGLTR